MKRGVYWDWDLNNYKRTVDALVYDLTRNKAIEVFDLCVQLSPVFTGGYRASWRISENAPANYYVGRQRPGNVLPPPTAPRLSTQFYRKFYVSNGSPYAALIEQGWSNQAPNGVMSVAIKLAGAS